MADRQKEVDKLRAEIHSLRLALLDHPSAHALRFVAPFIRDAIKAGVWPDGLGVESVEHEVQAALAWLKKLEAA